MSHKENGMEFITVAEFARRLKMHPGSVRRAIREGRIFAMKISNGKKAHHRISESEIERLHLKGMCEKQKG